MTDYYRHFRIAWVFWLASVIADVGQERYPYMTRERAVEWAFDSIRSWQGGHKIGKRPSDPEKILGLSVEVGSDLLKNLGQRRL